jgi:hypothetical protein
VTRLLVLLVVASQLADVATFGLAVRAQGIGGELGPLAGLYTSGGFGAVALAKCAAIGVAALILLRLSPRYQRPLALLVATVGVFGAATGLVAIA